MNVQLVVEQRSLRLDDRDYGVISDDTVCLALLQDRLCPRCHEIRCTYIAFVLKEQIESQVTWLDRSR
jgi:hypothetical protein